MSNLRYLSFVTVATAVSVAAVTGCSRSNDQAQNEPGIAATPAATEGFYQDQQPGRAGSDSADQSQESNTSQGG